MIFLIQSFCNISELIYNFVLFYELDAIVLLVLCLFTFSD